jgi:hypothetical protein
MRASVLRARYAGGIVSYIITAAMMAEVGGYLVL